ncbi:MAG: hypothetical protein M3Y53_00960 [Thermoproteota archaeon]|nr:hypothetical protein [Thermoproteota archaeon]
MNNQSSIISSRTSINRVIGAESNTDDNDPFAAWDKNQEAADKLVEFKKHLSEHLPPQEAHEITKAYLGMYARTYAR